MEPAGKNEESENVCDNLENSCQTFMAYIRGLTKLLAATKVCKKCRNSKSNISNFSCLFIIPFFYYSLFLFLVTWELDIFTLY